MRWSAKRLTPGTVFLPAIVLILCLGVYPLVQVLQQTVAGGIESYGALLGSFVFQKTLANTFISAGIATAICLLVAYPAAYWMDKQPKRKATVYLFLLLVPFAISILVRSYAWMALLDNQGVINRTLMALGLTKEPVQLLYTTGAVVVGMVSYLLPFMILAMYGVLSAIDRRLLDAAKSMGASNFYAFRTVYLPLSLPGVVSGAVYVFVLALGFYIVPSILGSAQDMTLPVYIQQQASSLQFGVAGAASSVLLVLSLGLFFVMDRLSGIEQTLSIE